MSALRNIALHPRFGAACGWLIAAEIGFTVVMIWGIQMTFEEDFQNAKSFAQCTASGEVLLNLTHGRRHGRPRTRRAVRGVLYASRA